MKILIGIPSGSGYIHSKVTARIANVVKETVKAGYDIEIAVVNRSLIDQARNELFNAAIQVEADYIFFIDDDTIVPKDSIIKMIERDKDMVTGVVPYRNGTNTLILRDLEGNPIQKPEKFEQIGVSGMGCMLIKKEVIEDLFNIYGGRPFAFGTLREKDKINMSYGLILM